MPNFGTEKATPLIYASPMLVLAISPDAIDVPLWLFGGCGNESGQLGLSPSCSARSKSLRAFSRSPLFA